MGNESYPIDSPLSGALYMLQKGYKVFPCRANEKRPMVKGWQQWAKECSEEKIISFSRSQPFCNWGVYCEVSEIIVLDVDNKGHKQGSSSLEALEKENLILPTTLKIKTPSGGFHYYFTGTAKSTQSELGEGLDTKSIGGYVVCPGSKIDQKEYQVVVEAPVVGVPDWLERKLNRRKEKLVRPADEEIEGSICEGQRDSELTRWAGVLRSQGLIYQEMFAALQVMNYERCNPPLPEDQVKKIAGSIANKPRGDALAAATFSMISDPDKLKKENDWPIDVSDFEQGKAPKRNWLIKDWLPVGEMSSLYGAGGSGKSLLSLQLGMAIATGGTFLGMEVETPMRVIGVYCEDDQGELHRRLDSIRTKPEYSFTGRPNYKFELWPRTGKENALVVESKDDVMPGPFMPKLTAYLSTLPREERKLIILDTLSDIYMGDENIREKVNKCVKYYLSALTKEFNLTMLLLAHPSRAGLAIGDLLSGSTAWNNSVRNRWGLKKKEKVTTLARLKSNYAESGEEIDIVWENGVLVVAGVETELEKNERDELAEFLHTQMKVDDKRSLKDILDQLLSDPGYPDFFGQVKAERHQKNKLMRLLKRGVSKGGLVFCYEQHHKARTKHIVVAKNQSDANAALLFE